MLSDDDKKRIYEEEIFRDEVRKSFQKKDKNSFLNKLWRFLNSSLGLWVLSTVVVGFAVSAFSKIQEKAVTTARNKEIKGKLDIEIPSRIRVFRIEIQRLLSEANSINELDIDAAAHSLDANAYGDYSPNSIRRIISNVFPEYKERNLESLIFETEQIDNKNSKDELRKASITINMLKQKLLNLPGEGIIKDPTRKSELVELYKKTFNEVLETLNTNSLLKKWSDS